jgi:hypothetical protein
MTDNELDELRPSTFAIACRMLVSVSEAEDPMDVKRLLDAVLEGCNTSEVPEPSPPRRYAQAPVRPRS